MGNVIAALNKRMSARSEMSKLASARAVLAGEKAKIEKAAQLIPTIREYLEKQGLDLGSLYRAIEGGGRYLGANPRVANAIGGGAVGAGLGGIEQGVQSDGNVLGGMAVGAGLGAGGVAGTQAAASLLLQKSTRIADALRHSNAVKNFGGEAGEEFMSRMDMAPGAFKQQARAAGADQPLGLGEKVLAGIGRGAEAVEGAAPLGGAAEKMERFGKLKQMPAKRQEHSQARAAKKEDSARRLESEESNDSGGSAHTQSDE